MASRSGWRAASLAGLVALALIAAFAFDGLRGPLGLGALLVLGLAWVAALPRPPWTVVLACLPLVLLTPPVAPGVYLFDGVAMTLGALALLASFQAGRSAWDVRWPGLLALGVVLVPLLAVPMMVVSLPSFLGSYRQPVLFAVTFLALRRLVPPAQSHRLLWAFPLTGALAALQVLAKLRLVGGRLGLYIGFRNFFTTLAWGRSNFVAALLAFCIFGTFLLAILEKNRTIRLILAGAIFWMLSAFLPLISRGATVALAVWALVLLVGWGRWKSIFAAGAIVLAVATFVLSPSGKGMVTRFTEPAEYMSVYTRTIGWEIAWERFLSHPLTGIGMNQGRYQADAMGDASAHNAMLDILMEEGIFGGIVFAAIVIAALRLCLRVRPFGYTGPQRTLRAALVSLLVGIMVNASVEPTITAIVIGTLFAWFLAWLSLQDSRPTTPRVEPDGLRGAESPGR